MFSRRTSWDRSSNRLTQLLEEKLASGDAILDLTQSNPTQVGLSYPESEILAPLANSASLRYEPDPSGLPRTREAVAGAFAGRGVQISPRDILLTASTSEAYSWLFKLLADPGDEILVPQPSYPLFDFLARSEGIGTVSYPLALDADWALDPAAVENRISPRSRAVAVVSPNNPTGTYLKCDELQALSALCARRGLALIGDEVFAEYPHGEDPRRAASVLGAEGTLAFSLGGLSKLAGLPQMKLGWIALSGPERKKEEAKERLELIADTFLSVNAPVQHAAQDLLRAAEGIRRQILRRIEENLQSIRSAVGVTSPFRLLRCEGGWTAVLRVPAIMTEEEWVLSLLAEDGVLAHPGYFFDFPAPTYLILSLLPAPETFREGVSRILARGEGKA
ncbi:MAG: pyridoxal phosphate-dependent aminotransferase [Acidobacteria bacterium]|nr:pyridoxal phosphate-dependent aminotransferase [Acidobacteriota bacterium]